MIQATTADYFEAQDLHSQWLAERCEVKVGSAVGSLALYRDWANWAKIRGEEPGTQKAFSAVLERNFQKKKTAAGAMFQGLTP